MPKNSRNSTITHKSRLLKYKINKSILNQNKCQLTRNKQPPNTPRPGELQRASLPQQRGFKMDNRQLIMNSALTLFYESGYDAVGVQQIVDSAGVSKPTLYYYFGSKQGLLEALLNEHFQPMEQKTHRSLRNRGKTSPKNCTASRVPSSTEPPKTRNSIC